MVDAGDSAAALSVEADDSGMGSIKLRMEAVALAAEPLLTADGRAGGPGDAEVKVLLAALAASMDTDRTGSKC